MADKDNLDNSVLGRNKLTNDPSRGTHENRQAKKPSKESERWLLAVVQNTSDVVSVVDADGTVHYVSPSIERMIGYRPQERMGRSCFELLHPEDLARARSTFAEALRRPGDTLALGVRMRNRDDSWRHVEVTGTNLLDDPSIRGIVINWRDVTDHKLAEEALKESEERFKLLVERVEDYAIFMLDAEGRISTWNEGARRIKGYEMQEIVGRHFSVFYPEEEIRRGKPSEELRVAMEKGHYEEEGLRIRKDGSKFWASVLITSLRDKDGNLRGFSKVVRDITERKRAEEALRESEERFRSIFDEASIGMAVTELDGQYLQVNRSLCEMLGYSEEELLATTFMGITHPGDLDTSIDHVQRLLEGELDSYQIEKRYLHAVGRTVWVSLSASLVKDSEDHPLYLIAQMQDITERKRADEALRRSESSLTEAQRIAHLGSWEWDLKTGEVWWSDETYRIYGFEPRQFSPTIETVAELFHPDDRHLFRVTIHNASKAEPYDFEHRIVRPDGEVRWVQRRGEVVRREGGESLQMIGTVHDITEQKALEERLHYQAFHDLLTDLPNRRLFMDRLEQALRRTRRRRGRKVAILFMDLDNFKVVNDSLGHEAGDRLLVAVSERLRRCLRPEDTIARFGGDEFTVLIEDVKEPVDAVKMAERIVKTLQEPFTVDGRELFVSGSIGIAFGGEAHTKLSGELLRHADAAMYQAKEDNLLNYEIFDSIRYEQVLGRLELENSLRRALENQELRVYYQPKFRLGQPNTIAGIEALIRWEHPQRGLILPEEFIPIAEQTGLILPLGRWILREACRQAKEWQERYPSEPPLEVGVNVSAEQVRYPGLTREVCSALRESGLEAGSLVLEITEGTLLKDTQESEAVLGELKALGVRLAIDDFGKEYSSLSYLKRLPVDGLKLDRSFVEDLGEDDKNTTIVGMVISLAHSLGLEVIGEGVESAKQLEYLREMRCDLVQGEHLAKPLPSEEVDLMLAASLRRLP